VPFAPATQQDIQRNTAGWLRFLQSLAGSPAAQQGLLAFAARALAPQSQRTSGLARIAGAAQAGFATTQAARDRAAAQQIQQQQADANTSLAASSASRANSLQQQVGIQRTQAATAARSAQASDERNLILAEVQKLTQERLLLSAKNASSTIAKPSGETQQVAVRLADSEIKQGTLRPGDKAKRVTELVVSLKDVESAGSLSKAQATIAQLMFQLKEGTLSGRAGDADRAQIDRIGESLLNQAELDRQNAMAVIAAPAPLSGPDTRTFNPRFLVGAGPDRLRELAKALQDRGKSLDEIQQALINRGADSVLTASVLGTL